MVDDLGLVSMHQTAVRRETRRDAMAQNIYDDAEFSRATAG